MPRNDYTGISLKAELAQSVEAFLKEHPTLSYRSLTQFVEAATQLRLEQLKQQYPELPRFEQVNTDENGTKILDRKIHEVVQVYIQPQGIKCGFDLTDDCEHIRFALQQPDIMGIVRKKRREGWNLPDV